VAILAWWVISVMKKPAFYDKIGGGGDDERKEGRKEGRYGYVFYTPPVTLFRDPFLVEST
jgi:hypothetical protein